ncbi:complement regulator-acquiring protein [Borreliella lusitaniae]|uniref:complement regulator-acquiring protein n=1 Tax=Borreliella lusitaniae TaxID=100177 RepID=UPI00292E3421|nr:complement regulator-acquiring protein [Borreliella lusitaniae]WNY67340.1 complement regulator-acquiring protein [Borreliella lusitaniae]
MKKPKINIIKLNIIKAAIITLICISCKSNNMPLGLKSEISKNIEDLKPLGQEFKNSIASILQKDTGCKNPKEALITQNFDPLTNEDLNKSTEEKLKVIGKYLKDQEAQEDREIAKIAASNYDFLSTFEIYPNQETDDYIRMRLKRMIYPGLNYEKQKIERFKKNLEKLREKDKDKAQKLLHDMISIQTDLKPIKEITEEDKLNRLTEEDRKKFLQAAVALLNIKGQFANFVNQIAEICN